MFTGCSNCQMLQRGDWEPLGFLFSMISCVVVVFVEARKFTLKGEEKAAGR